MKKEEIQALEEAYAKHEERFHDLQQSKCET